MTKVVFIKPIITSRLMQLYYHNCHHLTKGCSFFSDHEFFNTAYTALDSNYDRLSERYIAEYGVKAFETGTIITKIQEDLIEYKIETFDCKLMFDNALKLEKKYQQELQTLDKTASLGLKNLIGDLAEQSDVRIYKIQQRIMD